MSIRQSLQTIAHYIATAHDREAHTLGVDQRMELSEAVDDLADALESIDKVMHEIGNRAV